MGEKLPAHHLIALKAEARLRGNARGFLAFLPAQGLKALASENLRSVQQRFRRRLLRILRRILSGLRRIRGARRLPEGLRVSAGAARRERAAAVGVAKLVVIHCKNSLLFISRVFRSADCPAACRFPPHIRREPRLCPRLRQTAARRYPA